MNTPTLAEILFQTASSSCAIQASLAVQVTSIKKESTTTGKPYLTVEIADFTGKAKVKIWSDSRAFRVLASDLENGTISNGVGPVYVFNAGYSVNEYGLNLDRPSVADLTEEQQAGFYAGDADFQRRNTEDWEFVLSVVENFRVERLRVVVSEMLKKMEVQFRRAAAAYGNHHARRGGLLEHTAQMLRCAVAIAPLYKEVCADLLYSGVILHDIGKIVGTDYPERGFAPLRNMPGELLEHIATGAVLVTQWWGCEELDLRDHLIHLILSHHGQLKWGSPVTPKTPEAALLHQIDMIDSRMEMLRMGYKNLQPGADIVETRRGWLVRPYQQ